MRIPFLNDTLWFPPVEKALKDGLLACGGDLSCDRLILAYRSGIFPWFNENDIPLWWSPNPRFVLFPNNLVISKSMKKEMKTGKFKFTINTAFEDVIYNCKSVKRHNQEGTWLTDSMVSAYLKLNKLGYIMCGETWYDNKLVGGVYGVLIGGIFFGESMFTLTTNASKFAFINLVQILNEKNIQLIDCQVHTKHLESLGAKMIDRKLFMEYLKKYCQ